MSTPPLLLLPREDLPGTTTPSTSGSSSMTLPLLLAIAIGGGVLLFICLAFLLIALAGRRHRRAQARLAAAQCSSPRSEEGLGGGCASESGGGFSPRTPSPRRPRRLTKARPRTYMDVLETREKQPHRSLASIMGLPRSRTFNVFGRSGGEVGGGQQRGGYLRRNMSWIDEDAIHGPRVLKDERRLSIRDSFILRTPTLPDFSDFKTEEAFADGGGGGGRFGGEQQQQPQQQQYIQQPRPVSLPPSRSGLPPLPRTASYELAEKLAAAARGGVPPPSPQGPRPVPMPVPMQRLRHKTTESDLAEILRSTEERLQNGTPSNSRPTTRQRANSASAGSSMRTPRGSPTKSHSPVKMGSPVRMGSPTKSGSPVRPSRSPTRSQSPVKYGSPAKNAVITHVGQALDPTAQSRTRTPSPSKRMVVPVLVQTPVHPGHRRNTSQSSAVSDADSLFGETTPEIEHVLPTGLSSPSRRSDNDSPGNGDKPEERCTSMRSLGSNASSSLSTLYSVNEPEDDSKTGGKGEGGIVRGRKPKGLIIDTQICDPFVTPPVVPPRSPKRQASSLPPPLRRISPPEETPVIDAPFNSRSASNSPVPRPLDVIKRSSTADRSPTRLSIMSHSPDLAATPESIRPKSVASMKPVFLVSSTSVVSMKASPGTSPEDNSQRRPEMPNNRSTFGQKPIFPPPLSLQPGQTSPNREAMAMGSPAGTVSITRGGNGSPALRAVRDSREGSPSGSPPRRPAPNPELLGELRRGSPTLGRYKRRGMASPIRERAMSRQPANPRDNRADRMVPDSECPSIVLKPSGSPRRNDSFRRDFAVMGLQSTVAQLRRMNSQMSTLSGASSVSDPDSPTLPNMRGGGFSPDRSNSRVSKIGRQNYLSLGMSPKAKRNTIKGARNSIAVIKGRPGTAGRLDSLKAAVEEKENEEDTASQIIRGPRPLNPTPRSAGRGGPRASTGMMESPTRRASEKFEPGKMVDLEERKMEKARHQREALGKLAGLETHKEVSPRKVSAGLAAGTNRNSLPLRI